MSFERRRKRERLHLRQLARAREGGAQACECASKNNNNEGAPEEACLSAVLRDHRQLVRDIAGLCRHLPFPLLLALLASIAFMGCATEDTNSGQGSAETGAESADEESCTVALDHLPKRWASGSRELNKLPPVIKALIVVCGSLKIAGVFS